jgi:hypothetical protein
MLKILFWRLFGEFKCIYLFDTFDFWKNYVILYDHGAASINSIGSYSLNQIQQTEVGLLNI